MRFGLGFFLTGSSTWLAVQSLVGLQSITLVFAAAFFRSAKTIDIHMPCIDETMINDNDGNEGSEVLIFHISPEQRQTLLSSHPEEFARNFNHFIQKVKGTFDTVGVVLIRGLLDDELLDRLEKDSQAIIENSQQQHNSDKFVNVKFGPVFSDTSLREAALSSAIPPFVAIALLGMEMDQGKDCKREDVAFSSLHLLKDAFLAKGGEKGCCGWHVDDSGFWPTSAASRPGVNAWVAIDDIPANHGGGLAVSPGSHQAPWRHRAYEAIGSTKMYPDEGLVPGTPAFDKAMKSKVPGSAYGKTCNMEGEDPELARVIDGTRKVFDFRKGDVLFHTRWIFHRSMPLTKLGEEHFREMGTKPTFKRYSIRYDYGDSRLLRGLNAEFAAVLNDENKGKALAEVCRDDGPFYPRCWPESMSANELKEVDRLVAEKFPIAEGKVKELFAKLFAKK